MLVAVRRKLLLAAIACLFLFAAGMALLWQSNYRVPTYAAWLVQSGEAARVESYRLELARYGVAEVLTMESVLSAKRDALRCGVEPWVIPSEDLWSNLVPALLIIRELQSDGLLQGDEVTSVYRGESLNECAGGAARSKHLGNRAVDLKLLGDNRDQRYQRLCEFWRKNGRRLKFGLGFYDDSQIHIDGDGFRTWGMDYSSKSSLCALPGAR